MARPQRLWQPGYSALIYLASDDSVEIVQDLAECLEKLRKKKLHRGVQTTLKGLARADLAMLRMELTTRLLVGEVVASGYTDPEAYDIGRIEIPTADWNFLELDEWAECALPKSGNWLKTMIGSKKTGQPDTSFPVAFHWLLFGFPEARPSMKAGTQRYTEKGETLLRIWTGQRVDEKQVPDTREKFLRLARQELREPFSVRAFERAWRDIVPQRFKRTGKRGSRK